MIAEALVVVSPRLDNSVEHPEVTFVMTSWSVELLQAPSEHRPESQVLIPGIIELEFEVMRAIEMSPDGFRQAASGEAAMLNSVFWHCEDSPLKIIYINPKFIPFKKF